MHPEFTALRDDIVDLLEAMKHGGPYLRHPGIDKFYPGIYDRLNNPTRYTVQDWATTLRKDIKFGTFRPRRKKKI